MKKIKLFSILSIMLSIYVITFTTRYIVSSQNTDKASLIAASINLVVWVVALIIAILIYKQEK